MTAIRASIVASLYACLLIAGLPGLALPAQAQLIGTAEPAPEESPAPDPFGRETPRSAVTGLLRALAAQDYTAAAEFLSVPDEQDAQAAALAVALQQALDAGGSLQPYGELSNDPAGEIGDGLSADLERVGTLAGPDAQPVLLQRTEGEDGPPYWRVADETLRALEPVSAEVETPGRCWR